MSSLRKNPEKPKFDRNAEERRREDLGPPHGDERRQLHDRRVENNIEFVTFRIGDHLMGLPVNLAQEVIPQQKVTKIPRASAEIRGLMNLRGQIVTVLNLRRKLGLEDSSLESRMNVIVNYRDELLSLEVDSVGDVLPIAKHLILAAPPTLEGLWKESCQSVVQLEKGLLIIIEIEKIFGFQDSKKQGEIAL